MPKPILTTSEAARIYDVTPGRFRQLAREGRVPVAAVTEGGIRLYERRAVEEAARRRGQEGR